MPKFLGILHEDTSNGGGSSDFSQLNVKASNSSRGGVESRGRSVSRGRSRTDSNSRSVSRDRSSHIGDLGDLGDLSHNHTPSSQSY